MALTTELGGPMNFRLMPQFAMFQPITVPSLLPVNTDIQTPLICLYVVTFCHSVRNHPMGFVGPVAFHFGEPRPSDVFGPLQVLLGPFHGAIAVPSVTRCRRCRWRRGHRCAGGARQYTGDTWRMGVRRLAVVNGPNSFQMLLVILVMCLRAIVF